MRYILLLSLFLISCGTTSMINQNKEKEATNIILLIGDGMGLTQITAGIYSNDNYMNIERFSTIGLHKNYATDDLVTDSAAGATAFSCGVKTYNGAIGIDADSIAIETILEAVSKIGKKTGLIATSSIVHATPASFAAHSKSRDFKEEIAADMVESGVDLMIGGGKAYFDRRESDDRNLYSELETKGFVVKDYFQNEIEEISSLATKDKFAYFTADKEPLTYQAGRTYLEPASKFGLDFLNQKSEENGFFLMIEGSQIDWAGHANNFDYMEAELLEFDKVIGHAIDFAEKDGNTLVIVTADHETGGLAINPGSAMNNIVPAYTTDKHTASMIPVFAYGPGSELFSGIYENTEIYHKMIKAFGLSSEMD